MTTARDLTALSTDGHPVHVEVYGPASAPPVVLAHGWTCNTTFWAEQIDALTPDFRVIAYDQRGHGRSPHGPASTTALADDLEAVLATTLAPGEKAVIAGHSMGGMTIMSAAGRPRFEEHAAAALLCSTGSGRLVDESRVVPLLRESALRARLTRSLLSTRAPYGPVTPLSRKLIKYITMGPATPPARVAAATRIVAACPRGPRADWAHVLDAVALDENVGRLTVPTAVIAGSVDRLTPLPHARRLAGELPHCTGLLLLPGMGHMTPMEAPEAVTQAIRDLAAAYLNPTSDRPATKETV
ncbi:alpha/beta fold hydrolase [Streptomyces sp. NPDC060194]|uniref:alpha/beta fold hydrolase n=1 Tax=Streptomyces sp. NPDC060194 TaxID=3347069 RepID=UPI00364CFA2A